MRGRTAGAAVGWGRPGPAPGAARTQGPWGAAAASHGLLPTCTAEGLPGDSAGQTALGDAAPQSGRRRETSELRNELTPSTSPPPGRDGAVAGGWLCLGATARLPLGGDLHGTQLARARVGTEGDGVRGPLACGRSSGYNHRMTQTARKTGGTGCQLCPKSRRGKRAPDWSWEQGEGAGSREPGQEQAGREASRQGLCRRSPLLADLTGPAWPPAPAFAPARSQPRPLEGTGK